MTPRECVARLASRKEPPPLVPSGIWDEELDREIGRLPGADPALKSALHLWNDSLARAHDIAQEIKTRTGSYLHGLMHRREADYENSKYWFHKVGRHPHFPPVRAAALELLSDPFASLADLRKAVESAPDWDPFRMVDWCREAEGKAQADPLTRFLRALQAREMALFV